MVPSCVGARPLRAALRLVAAGLLAGCGSPGVQPQADAGVDLDGGEQKTAVEPRSDAAMADANTSPPLSPTVALGTIDEQAQVAFVPLEAGGDLALHTYGQGGLHVALTVECSHLGKEAWVDITMRSLGEHDWPEVDLDAGLELPVEGAPAGREVSTTPTRRPSLLVCDDLLDPQVCVHRPIIVMLGGLTDSLDALDGLHVEVTADVRNEAGLMRSDTLDVYLRR